MALLKNMATNEVLQLQRQHLFGSAHQWVDTLLVHECITPVHAVIFFTNNVWQMESFATENTIQIVHNGKRLSAGNSVRLELGCTISFAPDTQQWRLINTDPPKLFLHAVHTQDLYIELSQTIELPAEGCKQLRLQRNENDRWCCLKGEHSYELNEGSILAFTTEVWRFTAQLPPGFIYNPLHSSNTSHAPLFWFYVSQDEEHVNIKVDFNASQFDLGERANHYLLLLLARKRRDDIAAGYDTVTQGWIDVDDVTKQLRVEPNVLNMQITRLRRQFMKLKNDVPPLHKTVIERRPKQLRFAFADFKIYRGSTQEKD